MASKKADAAWWQFLAGALIVIAGVVFTLVLYGEIKNWGDSAVGGIRDSLGNLFK